ncbi:GmrSD restriction endonuclease domain-containing protein [Tolypothrix sp. VBCCA 56010]|uniref:GmrSD restriction endonuclease domain-containing protein n=1 Tax=Tolypothrix sp. VBCCA 56010 TaxID=3137731 RepID=UPI003D7E9EBA
MLLKSTKEAMPAIASTQSIRQSLQQILQSTKEGKTQLPDFQRSWVWNDEQILSLLASVSLSYPIGAVMMLETGNPAVKFKHRLLEGVALSSTAKPEYLILDGQQRITSLFQVLLSQKQVKTKDVRGKEVQRWYYVDITKALALNSNREQAIISVPSDRIIRNFRGDILADYSTTEKECAAEVFPLQLVLDTLGQNIWMQKYLQIDPDNMQNRLTLWTNFLQEVIQPYQQYQVPIIQLSKETPREAVCQVFEKVNTGGVFLTVFELLTATYAADDFNLREDWLKREKKLKKLLVLGNVQNTDFLQAVTLLATRAHQKQPHAISCTRKDILKLTLNEYKTWADQVTKGFEKAAKLLHTQKIFTARDLPYQPQLTVLAAIFAALGVQGDNAGIAAKLASWYWCGVFGEIYSGAIETRLAKDLPEVLAWTNGGSEPDTITSANFASARLINLRNRNSAAYKGLSALLMRDGAFDFRTGVAIQTEMYFDEKIDIHHIFPQKWCKDQNINPRLWDSILNKTPLSAKTNRMIGGKAPSIYLPKIQNQAGISHTQMNQILQTHVIDPTALRGDDFYNFLAIREKALLSLIEKAMNKILSPHVNQSTGSSNEAEDIELVEYDEDTDYDK